MQLRFLSDILIVHKKCWSYIKILSLKGWIKGEHDLDNIIMNITIGELFIKTGLIESSEYNVDFWSKHRP